MGQEKFAQSIKEHQKIVGAMGKEMAQELPELARKLVEGFTREGRLVFAGSGAMGAAADLAAHLFRHRMSFDRPLLPALSIGRDSLLAHSLARDGSYEEYFSRQLRALGLSDDMIVFFADSHRDPALVHAMELCKELGCLSALFVYGKAEGEFDGTDFLFQVDTASVARGLEAAVMFATMLCELVEYELFGV